MDWMALDAEADAVYFKRCRSILELAVPVWTPGLTKEHLVQLERVQKTALAIILGRAYTGYTNALKYLNIKILEERRHHLCLDFAQKAAKSDKYQHWFVRSGPAPAMKTRSKKPKHMYKEAPARSDRYKYFPIPFLTSLLNSNM